MSKKNLTAVLLLVMAVGVFVFLQSSEPQEESEFNYLHVENSAHAFTWDDAFGSSINTRHVNEDTIMEMFSTWMETYLTPDYFFEVMREHRRANPAP